MTDFKTLQIKAEFHYLRGDYKEAKRIYEQALFLTRKGTIKQNRVKECILDCQMHLDINDSLTDGSNELRNKLKES